MIDVNRLLRIEWWHNHGCPQASLYGDDGEMQCCACGHDFKRESIETLKAHVETKRRDAVLAAIRCESAACATCGKPIGPAVWCSIPCMEKAIGPIHVEPKTRT